MKTIAFFNIKGGVGRTWLAYHLAYMFTLRGLRVIAADFDPQANLTGMFLQDDRIEALWAAGGGATVYSAMRPLIEGTGDLLTVTPQLVADRLGLIPGDLMLSEIEDELSTQWPRCLLGEARAFGVVSAFDRIIRSTGAAQQADLGLIDVGPNFSAINRAALLAADYVIIPIVADELSIPSLQSLGPRLRLWRQEWQAVRSRAPRDLNFALPAGDMRPLGYILSGHASFSWHAPRALPAWISRIPQIYATDVFGLPDPAGGQVSDDRRLAQLKDYRSLRPMAQEARKPMFLLKPADGAIGGYQSAVHACYEDFEHLAAEIERRVSVNAPSQP
jgi:chromosome partitioning protein